MKKDVIVIALIAILFVLVAGSILASFTFYKEYKDKIDLLEQQSADGRAKLGSVEAKVDGFKATIDDITNQVKAYSESMKSIQNTVNLSDTERKAMLTKLEDMKKDLQGWQKDYSSVVIDIKQGMLTLKDDLDNMYSKSKNVELGKITVKQEDNKAVTEAPEKKAAGTSNFVSGSVRKVNAY